MVLVRDRNCLIEFNSKLDFEIKFYNQLRNDVWGSYFGIVQHQLSVNQEKELNIFFDLSNCKWIDPLPLLSILVEANKYKNKSYSYNLILADNTTKHSKKVLAFLKHEGFFDEFKKIGTTIYKVNSITKKREHFTREDEINLKSFYNELSYTDSQILPAMILDMEEIASTKFIVETIFKDVKHRIVKKVGIVSSEEILTKIRIFLAETLDNIKEHAYPETSIKPAGIFIRYRFGMQNKSNLLDQKSKNSLQHKLEEERKHCPRLTKDFVEDNIGFLECFILDGGIGLSKNYDELKNEKWPFRMAWTKAIGKGESTKRKKKKTEFGGLYFISKALDNSFLMGRDHNEWIGEILPIDLKARGRSNYYLFCNEIDKKIRGLSLLARIPIQPSKFAMDVINDGVKDEVNKKFTANYIEKEYKQELDTYNRFFGKSLDQFSKAPVFIKDLRFKNENTDYDRFVTPGEAQFGFLFPPNDLSKNTINELVVEIFSNVSIKSHSIFICDIARFELLKYKMALEKAKYENSFIYNVNRIFLISNRLEVVILKYDPVKRTYLNGSDEELLSFYFNRDESTNFVPDVNIKHVLSLIRTHDSFIFWLYVKKRNATSEFFTHADITWFEGDNEVQMSGYLNFYNTVSDKFIIKLFEYALERFLGFEVWELHLIDELIAPLIYTLPINSQSFSTKKQLLIGSVFTTGYTLKNALKTISDQSSKNLHLFKNKSVLLRNDLHVPHLFLWPLNNKEWLTASFPKEKRKYKRIGDLPFIAEHGWKHFPIPKYYLKDKHNNYLLNYIDRDVPSLLKQGYEFDSVSHRTPKDTYDDWQSKDISFLNFGHYSIGTNHDIINIDYYFVLKEAIKYETELAKFFLVTICSALEISPKKFNNLSDKFIDEIKKGIDSETSRKKFDAILFAEHAINIRIFNLLNEIIGEKYRKKFIPIKELSRSNNSNLFFVSDKTTEKIRRRINSKRSKNSVLIFDNAILRGNRKKNIYDYLKSIGIKEVDFFCLVNREGRSFTEIKPYKDYWELNIPRLGKEESCFICRATKKANTIEPLFCSELAKERIKSWILTWSARIPLSEKIFEISDVELIKPRKKLGVYIDEEGNTSQCGGPQNKIRISNINGLLIYLLEIQGMTARESYIYDFLQQEEIELNFKLIVLNFSLITYYQEFSSSTKKKLIELLILTLNDYKFEDSISSISALTLLNVDETYLESCYELVEEKLTGDVIDNYDLKIIFSFVSTKNSSKFKSIKSLNRLLKSDDHVEFNKKSFHRELYNDFGRHHNNSLYELKSSDTIFGKKRLIRLNDSIDKLHSMIKEIHFGDLAIKRNEIISKSGMEEFESNILKIKDITNLVWTEYENKKTTGEIIESNIVNEDMEALCLDYASKVSDFIDLFHTALFCEVINRGKFSESKIKLDIEDLIQEAELNEICKKNEIKFSKQSVIVHDISALKNTNKWLYWDSIIQKQIYYSLTNVRHIKEAILDPFSNENEYAKMWITIEIFNNRTVINLFNQSLKNADFISNRIKIRGKFEKYYLEKLKGSLEYEDVQISKSRTILKTKISIPYV